MAESQTGIASTMDEQVILEDPVPEGAVNVWFYRTQAATGYRMTLIQFSSLYSKQQKFLEINGPNIEVVLGTTQYITNEGAEAQTDQFP